MRKGRHRRHQEARALKQGHWELTETETMCDECRRRPHADWCLADEDLAGDDLGHGGDLDHGDEQY